MNDDVKKDSQNISSSNPDLKSVLGEMEEQHYLFIVADKKKASLFLFKQGQLESSREIMHPGVRKETRLNSGDLWGRSHKLEHRADNQLHSHLQLIVGEAEILIQGKHINGVFIGGHQPLFHTIEKVLPPLLQNKLRGEFVTELNIPQDELIKHCQKKIEEYIKPF